MHTPFLPVGLLHSTIGPVSGQQTRSGKRWTDFAARLRVCIAADDARVLALRQSLASGRYGSDAAAIASRMLAFLSFRSH
jgi:anti-sigma28 factor (negative regulator of flagellin synthesis)